MPDTGHRRSPVRNATSKPAQAGARQGQGRPSVLIVEDEADIRDLLADTLSLRNYVSTGAATGRDGIRLAGAHCPDLVLLDVGLPDISGLEVLRQVKQACPRTAVVIVTARTALDVAVTALNAGADGYVAKPFLVDELLAVVDRARERQALLAELERLAVTDGLTGLYNRRHFEEVLQEEELRAQRYKVPVTVVMIDVNHLKYVNDHYGHARGDGLLKETANLLRQNTRGTDTVARYGGDEMTIVMPETTQQKAAHFVRRLRQSVAQRNQETTDIPLSLAIGYASRPPCPNLDMALRLADERMYKDKARQKVARRAPELKPDREVGKRNEREIA
mgnify:CR=1 FL=1